MTTFAMSETALRRLFEELDFAVRPRNDALARIFGYWRAKRAGQMAPPLEALDVADLGRDGAQAFLLRFADETARPTLVFGGTAFGSLMGFGAEGGWDPSQPGQRRSAVRLRRLCDLERQQAEPVRVEYSTRIPSGTRMRVEMLVAPLTGEDQAVTGIFGGVVLREVATGTVGTRRRTAPPGGTGPLLFAMNSAASLAELVADRLQCPIQPHEERDFEDGEHKSRSLVDVTGGDVHVVAALHGDARQSVNDRLCRMLFFIGALKEAGARRVTVTAPYLCYARKDRQTKSRDPVTTRYVAQIMEAVGTDRVITMDVHNLAAFQNAFRCQTTHLEAASAFCDQVAGIAGSTPVAVVSPDLGGGKRVELFRQALASRLRRSVGKGIAEKERSGGRISGDMFMGEVDGCIAVILDDLVSTGATMARVAQQCRDRGAKQVILAATHGVGGMASVDNLRQPAIDKVILTNTVPQTPEFAAAMGSRLEVIDVSDIFARAILHGCADPAV